MITPFRVSDGMRSKDKLEAANAYIAAGFKIVITEGLSKDGRHSKRPLGKYFPQGVDSATDEIDLIEKVLRRHPQANIAVGLKGRTVIDTDGEEGAELVDQLDLPRTIRSKTPRGAHEWFEGEPPRGSFKALQVDVLSGPKRYVTVPPSIGDGGKPYRWLEKQPPRAVRYPSDVEKLRKSVPRRVVKQQPAIRSGARNETLFKISCSLRRHFDEGTTLNAIRAINGELADAPLSDAEVEKIVESAFKYETGVEDLFGPPKIRESLPQKFLWYPYIPKHGLTILAGDPGRGKSLLVALLISLVTSGRRLPLADHRAEGEKVLLLSAEGNWARVTLARLEKAGFDIGNLHIMARFRALTSEVMEALREKVQSWHPSLIVIDTLPAYMGGGRDMHRQNEVSEFLTQLTELAEEVDAAVLGLAHLNKQGNETPLYRIVGSIGFVATIRSALFFGKDPNDPDRLAMAHGKANGSEEGPTIIFERVGGGRDQVPVLKAVGTSDATAADVCRVPVAPVGRPSEASEAAADFIMSQLSAEPVQWSKIQLAAEARGVASASTINAVRARLAHDGRIKQVGRGKKALWVRKETDEPE